jgi:hypothetical protein
MFTKFIDLGLVDDQRRRECERVARCCAYRLFHPIQDMTKS